MDNKTGHARKTVPQLLSLPPTRESFEENVKRAHLQAVLWKRAFSPNPPHMDTVKYGWMRDDVAKELSPVMIPPGVPCAPRSVLEMIKCTCRSSEPCSSSRCSCYAAQVSCTIVCSCQGEQDSCCSSFTRL